MNQSKISTSEQGQSDAKSDFGKRSKKSNDTPKIKVNQLISDLKNLQKHIPKEILSQLPKISEDDLNKSNYISQEQQQQNDVEIINDLVGENDQNNVANENLAERINGIQMKFQENSFIPYELQRNIKSFNQNLLNNLQYNPNPVQKQYRFYKQDEIQQLAASPISKIDFNISQKPNHQNFLLKKKTDDSNEENENDERLEDLAPDKIKEISQMSQEIRSQNYRQTLLTQYSFDRRFMSPLDKFKVDYSQSPTKLISRKISKQTFGDLYDQSHRQQEIDEIDEQIEEEFEEKENQISDLKRIGLIQHYVQKTTEIPQHSLLQTTYNNSISPDFTQMPIQHSIEYVMNGDVIIDVAPISSEFQHTQGRNQMKTVLELSPYSRMTFDKSNTMIFQYKIEGLDLKQMSIVQGVTRAFININSLKASLIEVNTDCNFEELMTVLQYLNYDQFFNRILLGKEDVLEDIAKQLEIDFQKTTRPQFPLDSDDDEDDEEENEDSNEELEYDDEGNLITPKKAILIPFDNFQQSAQKKYEPIKLKQFAQRELNPQEEKEKQRAIKEEIYYRAIFQGGKQYDNQRRRLSNEYKRLYIDREHQQTQVDFQQILKETKLELDDVLVEIKKMKQQRFKLKHLPENNTQAIQIAVDFYLKYEKLLFRYLAISLGEENKKNTNQQLLEKLKITLQNLKMLKNKRHKVRRQTKLLYFFLSEYQKCIETYMKQQKLLGMIAEEQKKRKMQEELENKKTIHEVLYEFALQKQQIEREKFENSTQRNKSQESSLYWKPVGKATESQIERQKNQDLSAQNQFTRSFNQNSKSEISMSINQSKLNNEDSSIFRGRSQKTQQSNQNEIQIQRSDVKKLNDPIKNQVKSSLIETQKIQSKSQVPLKAPPQSEQATPRRKIIQQQKPSIGKSPITKASQFTKQKEQSKSPLQKLQENKISSNIMKQLNRSYTPNKLR